MPAQDRVAGKQKRDTQNSNYFNSQPERRGGGRAERQQRARACGGEEGRWEKREYRVFAPKIPPYSHNEREPDSVSHGSRRRRDLMRLSFAPDGHISLAPASEDDLIGPRAVTEHTRHTGKRPS